MILPVKKTPMLNWDPGLGIIEEITLGSQNNSLLHFKSYSSFLNVFVRILDTLELEFIDSYEWLCGCWEVNPGFLEEQSASHPSLQLLKSYSYTYRYKCSFSIQQMKTMTKKTIDNSDIDGGTHVVHLRHRAWGRKVCKSHNTWMSAVQVPFLEMAA